MKKLRLAAGVLLMAAAAGARAHAHLKASNPEEGAVVAEMPASISLSFSESARITALALQKEGAPAQKLAPPAATGEQIDVPVPTLAPGRYTLRWRVLSTDDGHIMSGELHFTVAAAKH